MKVVKIPTAIPSVRENPTYHRSCKLPLLRVIELSGTSYYKKFQLIDQISYAATLPPI